MRRAPPGSPLDVLNEAMKARIFVEDVLREAARARTLFPKPDGVLAALTEEVGEVARAMLDESWDNVRTECVQVAAMALRLALEGDPTLDAVRAQRAKK